tara:strand:+ start:2360 stop:2467 length:108 start_codon:yes stop_codon:yes gene_type:complete
MIEVTPDAKRYIEALLKKDDPEGLYAIRIHTAGYG